MFTTAKLNNVKRNDILVLRDFHTMSHFGEDQKSFPIQDIHVWSFEGIHMYGFEVEVDDDITLMLLVRYIDNTSDCRIFRKWDEQLMGNFLVPCGEGEEESIIQRHSEGPHTGELDFANFSIIHEGEEDEGVLEYIIKSPYPFWNAEKNDGSNVAVCEYLANDDDLGEYWATHAFAEWYAYVGVEGDECDEYDDGFVDDEYNEMEDDEESDEGEDGLLTLWFGWDVGDNDFEFISS